jgi:hypothetical protein
VSGGKFTVDAVSDVLVAVDKALATVPEDDANGPLRAAVRRLAAMLDGDVTPTAAASLARELRVSMAILAGAVTSDEWGDLVGSLGDS